jgi:hypothetical protein
LDFFAYVIQHCFNCRPSDSTVLEDAGIEPRTVSTLPDALATRLAHIAKYKYKYKYTHKLQTVVTTEIFLRSSSA